jgi:hypothetical protein
MAVRRLCGLADAVSLVSLQQGRLPQFGAVRDSVTLSPVNTRVARQSVVQRLVRNGEIDIVERIPQIMDPLRKIVVAAARLVRPEGDDFP